MINEDQDVERRLYNEKKKVAGISVTCSMCCCDSMSIYMDDLDIFQILWRKYSDTTNNFTENFYSGKLPGDCSQVSVS